MGCVDVATGAEILATLRRTEAAVRSGIDPDRFRFFVASGERSIIEEALVGLGLDRERHIPLYTIYESETIDPGKILLHDTREEIDWKLQDWNAGGVY
jgi:hypothetical protein